MFYFRSRFLKNIRQGQLGVSSVYDEKYGLWRGLDKMDECFDFSSHMSLMMNGSPTKEFKVERGLRQGDPISPFCHCSGRFEGFSE